MLDLHRFLIDEDDPKEDFLEKQIFISDIEYDSVLFANKIRLSE